MINWIINYWRGQVRRLERENRALRGLAQRCASIKGDCCAQESGVWGMCIHDVGRRLSFPDLVVSGSVTTLDYYGNEDE